MSNRREKRIRHALKVLQDAGHPVELDHPNPIPGQSGALLFQMKAEAFSGPLPPPSMLADYNNLVPRGAERIMAMAEKQQEHRHHLEKQVVEGNVRAQRVGQRSAFVLSFIAITGGVYLMAIGKEVWGLVPLVGAVAGLAVTFIIGRKKQDDERTEKREKLPEKLK